MLPIKSFNPASSPNGGMIALNATDPGARILFYNESNNNIKLDFRNGNQDMLHAWEARWWTLDGNTDEIDWTIDSTLSALAAPISFVMGTLYGPDEELPGVYPISLIRQTNVGNTINTVGGVANSIQNDGNTAATPIIEATVGAESTSAVKLSNDAQMVLGNNVHGGMLDVTNPAGDHMIISGDGIGVTGNDWQFLDTRTLMTKLLGISNNAGGGVGLGGNGTLDATIDTTGLALLTGNMTIPNASALQAKDAGGTARAVLLTTAGNVLILRALAGASGQTIQLQDETGTAQIVVNDVSPQVEIKNDEQIDGNVTIANAKSILFKNSLGAAELVLAASASDQVILRALGGNGSKPILIQDVNHTTQLTIADTAPQVQVATQLGLPVGSLSRISKFTASVTTTPTLFNHGLGAVPDIVLLSINGTSSAAAGVQYDVATMTTTQVKLTGTTALSVVGLAIKF